MPSEMLIPPAFTVIVEWENQILAEAIRSKTMLETLDAQIRALAAQAIATGGQAPAVEVLIAFNPDEVDEAATRAFVAEALPAIESVYALSWVALPGCHYYEIKNGGADRARHDLLVFIDSDVVPEPGWLIGMLAAAAAFPDGLVGGYTYVKPETTLEKAFALGWFFPWRLEDGPMYADASFWANNFAVSRALFLAHRFPAEPWRLRGACYSLALRFKALGVPIVRVPTARMSHAIPNGPRHLLNRAMCHGRDSLHPDDAPLTHRAFLRGVATDTWRRMAASHHRIWHHREEVGLRIREIPFAVTAMALFNLLYAPGKIWGHYHPSSFRRLFFI